MTLNANSTYTPSGLHNKANEYFKKDNHVRIAKENLFRSKITTEPPAPPSSGVGVWVIGTNFTVQ